METRFRHGNSSFSVKILWHEMWLALRVSDGFLGLVNKDLTSRRGNMGLLRLVVCSV